MSGFIPVPFVCVFVDSSTLSDHKICENSKLHLFVKKAVAHARSVAQKEDALWPELTKFLGKHFSEADAEVVLDIFKEVRCKVCYKGLPNDYPCRIAFSCENGLDTAKFE